MKANRGSTKAAGPKRYLAVLGDLVGSRDAPDRARLSQELKDCFRDFARPDVREQIAAGPEITSGDEFQLLLHWEWTAQSSPGEAAARFLQTVSDGLSVGVAFGLGVGTLSTGIRGPIRELDGTCFHRAREALQEAKREGRWAVLGSQVEDDGGPDFNIHRGQVIDAINALLRLEGEIRRTWTSRQLEIVRLTRTIPRRKDIAEKIQVSPSVVSEALKAARHDAVWEAEERVKTLIDWIAEPERFEVPGPGAKPEPAPKQPAKAKKK